MIKRERVLLLLVITFLGICSLGTTSILYAYQNTQLKERNANLEQAYFEIFYDYIEVYIDLMGDAYDIEVERAVLEERVIWLEQQKEVGIYTEIYFKQFYEDVDAFLDFMEFDVIITNDWDVSVENFRVAYPLVYERLRNY